MRKNQIFLPNVCFIFFRAWSEFFEKKRFAKFLDGLQNRFAKLLVPVCKIFCKPQTLIRFANPSGARFAVCGLQTEKFCKANS